MTTVQSSAIKISNITKIKEDYEIIKRTQLSG